MTHDTGAGSGHRMPPSSTYGSGATGSSSTDPTTPIATPASTPGATPDDASTTDVAKAQARQVGTTAKHEAAHVAGTAKDQAKEVAAETKAQARDLLREGRTQARDQARQGQRRAADGLTSLSDELRQMADTGQSGLASDVARQAADKAHDLALWLQKREPGDLVEEARSWARRNPGTFLIGAALAGLAVGRLTRGIVDDQRDSGGGTIGSGTRLGGYDSAYDAGYDTRYRTSSDPGYGANGMGSAPAAPRAMPTSAGSTPYGDTSARGSEYDPAYSTGSYAGGTPGTTGDLSSEIGRGQTAPGMGAPGTMPAYDAPPGTVAYDDPDDRGYGTGGGTTGRTTP